MLRHVPCQSLDARTRIYDVCVIILRIRNKNQAEFTMASMKSQRCAKAVGETIA
jgi:hypothetical protein